MIRKLICWVKAIPLWFRCGEWVPHIYTCDYEKVNIATGERHFRVTRGYEHAAGEKVYPDACLITYTCNHCGHKTYAWYPSWSERWRLEE